MSWYQRVQSASSIFQAALQTINRSNLKIWIARRVPSSIEIKVIKECFIKGWLCDLCQAFQIQLSEYLLTYDYYEFDLWEGFKDYINQVKRFQSQFPKKIGSRYIVGHENARSVFSFKFFAILLSCLILRLSLHGL